jgi:EAL domain-containing protein (putative c-di-GMP-specific phosphodiesterase class I)
MRTNSNDETIVRATINLGHNLGLSVTAEGIEEEDILMTLKKMRCDIAQGNYISPAKSLPELEAWMANYSVKGRAAHQGDAE